MNYLGQTATIAKLRLYQARQLRTHNRENMVFLAWGPHGTGKTTLLREIAVTLTGIPDDSPELRKNQLLGAVEYRNGQSVSVDVVREWRRSVGMRPMFTMEGSGRRVFLVDECDAMATAALNEWRTFIDTMPPGNDVLLSTNVPLDELQPQLQSRAMHSKFETIPASEIATLLVGMGIPTAGAKDIAAGCRGDVRAALNDAKTALAMMAMMAEAA